MLTQGNEQYDVQDDNLIKEINPNLTDQNDNEHDQCPPIESHQIDQAHQATAFLTECQTDIIRNVITITIMKLLEHPLQNRRSVHLKHRIPAIQKVKKLIDAITH